FPFPIPDLKDFREETKTFEAVAALLPPGRAPIGGDDGHPEQVRVGAVTPNLFSVLGARIQLGRDFNENDGAPQPANAVAAGATPAAQQPPPTRLPIMTILSHGLWQRKYAGDPSVIGKTIDLGGNRAEIVGVLAPGFEVLFPPRTGIDPAV